MAPRVALPVDLVAAHNECDPSSWVRCPGVLSDVSPRLDPRRALTIRSTDCSAGVRERPWIGARAAVTRLKPGTPATAWTGAGTRHPGGRMSTTAGSTPHAGRSGSRSSPPSGASSSASTRGDQRRGRDPGEGRVTSRPVRKRRPLVLATNSGFRMLDHAVPGTASKIFDGSWHAPLFGAILDSRIRRGRGGKR